MDVALRLEVEADLHAGGKLDGQVRAADFDAALLSFQRRRGVGAGVPAQLPGPVAAAPAVRSPSEAVLAEGPGLDDEAAQFIGVEVHQANDGAAGLEFFPPAPRRLPAAPGACARSRSSASGGCSRPPL